MSNNSFYFSRLRHIVGGSRGIKQRFVIWGTRIPGGEWGYMAGKMMVREKENRGEKSQKFTNNNMIFIQLLHICDKKITNEKNQDKKIKRESGALEKRGGFMRNRGTLRLKA